VKTLRLLVPALLLGAASSANAQAVCTNSQGYFGIAYTLFNPGCPMDFDYLTSILVFGFTPSYLDPIDVNALDIVFNPADDQNDPVAL
jgi:hypothetical protein